MRGAGAALIALALASCAEHRPGCTGPELAVPSTAARGYSVSQLMAQAAAMGMTTEEAQTLIYLEGLNPQATLAPGETICLDGRPDPR